MRGATSAASAASRGFNAVATVAKLLPLVLLVIVGAFDDALANLAWTTRAERRRGRRAPPMLLIFAFSGVESALVPSGEVKDPARTVPRAIFIAMAVVALLYIAIQLVAQGVLGAALASDATPLADAAGVALGPAGRTLLLVGSAVSMFGYVSGMTLAVPRALFAFGRDGFLPRALARVHRRFHTPHVAIVVQTVDRARAGAVRAVRAARRRRERRGAARLRGVLLAAAELRRRDVRSGGIPFRVPGGAAVPWLALARDRVAAVGTARRASGVAAALVAAAARRGVRRDRADAPRTSRPPAA